MRDTPESRAERACGCPLCTNSDSWCHRHPRIAAEIRAAEDAMRERCAEEARLYVARKDLASAKNGPCTIGDDIARAIRALDSSAEDG